MESVKTRSSSIQSFDPGFSPHDSAGRIAHERMALNVSMMYRRTDRGVREVYEKSHQFTQSERLILILLDGRLNVAGLKTRLPSLNDERIERALRKLQEASLVEPISYDT